MGSALSYLILLSGILTFATTVFMVVSNYSPLPFLDGWTQLEIAADGRSPVSPAWLWQQHNEHRLVLPKLFLAADLGWFQARQVLLLASILLIQLLHWALLSWSLWALGLWRGALWRSGAGLAAFCVFCPSQWQNFTWGFQVCFVLPQLLATASIVALLLYWREAQAADRSPRTTFLILALLAALGSGYSLASGNLLWPLLFLTALYLRLRPAAVLSVALTGVVSTSLYLYHYVRPLEHANPLSSLHSPLTLLKYVAVYFVSSWQHRDMHISESAALVVLLIIMAALTPTLSHLHFSRPLAIELFFIMLFCAGTALITATGRVNFGVEQARASRYQTVALAFWCCLGLLWLGAVYARPRFRAAFFVAQLCLLLLMVRAALTVRYPFIEAGERSFAQKVVADALITGVPDPTTLGKTYGNADVVLRVANYMKANHLSIFADALSSQPGKLLSDVFPLSRPGECVGVLQGGRPVHESTGSGLFLAGWAWDVKRHKPASEIVITTNGTISGLGAVGAWLPGAHSLYGGITSSYIGFFALLPQPPAGALVNVYAVLDGKPATACYLDGWRQAGGGDFGVHRM